MEKAEQAMSGDDDVLERLWGGERQPSREPKPDDDKVVPLRPPGDTAESVTPFHERVYKAFVTRDRTPRRLHICTATQGSLYPSYHHLGDFRFGHDQASIISLIYPFMTIEITGRNLTTLAHALQLETCAAIYEYHANLYPTPPKSATVIEKITVLEAKKFL